MSENRNAGKGDTPRPFSVDPNTYAANWERAFGKRHEPTSGSTDEIQNNIHK